MTGRLAVGVLGCADIARRRVLPALAAHPDVDLVAVASRDAARAARTAGEFGCRPVTGYAALLADEAVQAVYVPLPAALHAAWVEAALRAGKHVHAEKPLTTDPARTRELLRLARDRRLALTENVMFVHHARHAVVRDLVAAGAIGKLRSFHASFAIPEPPEGDIRWSAALGGGSLWDVGLYPVRAAVHLLGTDLEVLGASLTTGPGREVDGAGAVLLRTAAGVTAQLTFGMRHAYRNRYELWGSAGHLTVDRAFTPPADLATEIRVETAEGTRTVTVDPDDQVANTVTAFVRAVREGTAPTADCLAQADLLAELHRAASNGPARRPGTGDRDR
ncbi:Gfo/Idh/MocA family oxidoreductase [Micromonospora sp. NPDC002296]|uniref:Gfo/Idh/MocA family protein n=1 Tax=Micromonospora sp. NPDC002296 TaxID=3154271 RepID=UPI003324B109